MLVILVAVFALIIVPVTLNYYTYGQEQYALLMDTVDTLASQEIVFQYQFTNVIVNVTYYEDKAYLHIDSLIEPLPQVSSEHKYILYEDYCKQVDTQFAFKNGTLQVTKDNALKHLNNISLYEALDIKNYESQREIASYYSIAVDDCTTFVTYYSTAIYTRYSLPFRGERVSMYYNTDGFQLINVSDGKRYVHLDRGKYLLADDHSSRIVHVNSSEYLKSVIMVSDLKAEKRPVTPKQHVLINDRFDNDTFSLETSKEAIDVKLDDDNHLTMYMEFWVGNNYIISGVDLHDDEGIVPVNYHTELKLKDDTLTLSIDDTPYYLLNDYFTLDKTYTFTRVSN